MDSLWHWSIRLADNLIRLNKNRIVITAGITPSGPVHLGSVCEFLFPEAIYRVLKMRNNQIDVKMYFIADVLDALDSVTADLQDYESVIKEDMGKPLILARDPKGIYRSYAERYVEELRQIMRMFNSHLELILVSDLYERGMFDKYTDLYMRQIDRVKEIVQKTSGRELPHGWTPIMAICGRCGRIDRTRVLFYDPSVQEYEYRCDSCGHTDRAKLEDHKYKLQWRLHWPTWQTILESDIEGGGVDHFTKGGSRDTAVAIHREILNREPPIGYKYGFVLLDGKKYSKSKGIGMYVRDMLKIVPPEIVAYHLLKYDLEENIDFNPTKDKILNMIDDYESASQIDPTSELSRAERKKYVAFNLFRRDIKVSFREMLLYYSVYRDWNKVRNHIELDEYYMSYIENWYRTGFVPEDYDFTYRPSKIDEYKDLVSSWHSGMSALDIHNSIYDYSQKISVPAQEIFRYLYRALIGKDRGPRMGKLIYALGVDRVKDDIL
ncbi:MAG: lysine--tRNA ligase [Candidatus Micrarchaeota archaeon]|nr:lysine--tRNA ligase [Candidatus Micrarchaeota archaeon]MCX8154426.1 lysine--tRNA ligase [Candidatus Micrarchaeota archaeon]